MSRLRTAAIAGAALLAVAGTAFAQNPDAFRTGYRGQLVALPSGAVVLVLPPGAVPVPQAVVGYPVVGYPVAGGQAEPVPAFAAFPDPFAIFRQIHAMMAAAERGFGATAVDDDRGAPGAMQGVSSFSISSVTNGGQSCTREITYTGSGAPKVHVFGNACGGATAPSRPAALPGYEAPEGARPRTLGPESARPRTLEPESARPRTLEIDHRGPAAPALPHVIQAEAHTDARAMEVAQLR